ncbi:hypothetical protein [Paraburkholderia hospita]|uniref:hypothetical protein n=1 Tax=Paraburkholderia hospita TaxID=169430 RepID=UPI001177403D|nr:hypothetical protein [Paraburkholderia hospita]
MLATTSAVFSALNGSNGLGSAGDCQSPSIALASSANRSFSDSRCGSFWLAIVATFLAQCEKTITIANRNAKTTTTAQNICHPGLELLIAAAKWLFR